MRHHRYIVFVSSTYKDLKKERDLIMKGLLSVNCIPTGMEQFPAGNDETFEYIKKIISDSDYYLLILAGKYGTPAPDGIGYTEKEFDYANSQGIPIIALLYKDIGKLPSENTEPLPEIRKKLDSFRKKIESNRIVKYWSSPEGLKSDVVTSIQHAIRDYPRPGLVRGNGESIKVFETSREQQEYFLSRIEKAKQVHDLTWAIFASRTDSQSDTVEYEQKRKIALIKQQEIIYDEIFVFNDGQRARLDRLKKLKDHYEVAVKGVQSNYSCSFYEAMDFPRLQYTVIDQKEILFTSGQNIRCAVYDIRLAEVFIKYFEQAWKNAIVLIDNGVIVHESEIKRILKQLSR